MIQSMRALLVHGVPDTSSLWDPMRALLTDFEIEVAALPGFGCDLPTGFGGSKDDYAQWLIERIEATGAPVDLVAHDWGALLAQRVAHLRPDLLRSLAFGSGPLDESYVWHDTAQAWQTPEVGEAVMDGILAMSQDDRASILEAGGAPAALARDQANSWDPRMSASILGLYRSVIDPESIWPQLNSPVGCPTLVLWGADDPHAPPEFGRRVATRINADLLIFEGCAHWWPWARAKETSEALRRLWGSI
jgi:pimeloyl-ACP methyl ester carboxylesterase